MRDGEQKACLMQLARVMKQLW